MATLQFMPWCPIDKAYQVGEIRIIPFTREAKMERLDQSTANHIRTILSSYRNLDGEPVSNAALIKHSDKPILADLSNDELDVTQDCLAVLRFSGLARRAYFNPLGPYCNADCFIFYGQKFQEEPRFSGITCRRREGRTVNVLPLEKTTFTVPVHVSVINELSLDEGLLTSLVDYRDSSSDEEWARWQNAISCFNQANTDNESVSMQVEWVLVCSAFERLLNARSDAKDVAEKFASALAPSNPVLISHAKRQSSRWTELTRELRYEWIREFYAVRGDFAHGRLQSRQPMAWKPLEHLVLGSIAFPLLVKCLLAKTGKYTLTEEDSAEIDALEPFGDEDFLQDPPDQTSSIDSWWSRHVMKAKKERLFRRIAKEFEESDN